MIKLAAGTILKWSAHYFLDNINYIFNVILYGCFRRYALKCFLWRAAKKPCPSRSSYLIFQKQLKSHIIVDPSRIQFYIKKHEPNVVKVLKGLLNEESTFVDVGAYIGFYTIFSAKLKSKVISLEPDPRNYKVLLCNVRLAKINNEVVALNMAASDRTGEVPFKLSKYPSESSMTSYLKPESVFCELNVPTITLDTLLKNLGLKKVDVEGAGFKVLKGAQKILAEHKPKIIFEVHKTYEDDNELQAVKFLKNYGYKTRILEYRGKQNFILYLYP
ncbi:MAG: FkbM family methyltransferase [Candidatus Aenigmatarchaeota archaeon]